MSYENAGGHAFDTGLSVAIFGWPLVEAQTGKFVDDVFPPDVVFRDYVIKIPADVVEQKCPLFTVNVLSLPGQASPMKVCRLTLPLSNDGVTVNMLLNAIIYEYPTDDRQNISTALTFETLSREYL